MLGVSTRTRHRRRHELGSFDKSGFSVISDNKLDGIVTDVLHVTPQAGRKLVRGTILARGLRVQRRRIEASISRIEPVTTTLRDQRRIIQRIYNFFCG